MKNDNALRCAIAASFTFCLVGYDNGVMSGATIFLRKDPKLSDGEVGVLFGIFNLCSVVGSALAGRTCDWIGRRRTIILATSILFLGTWLTGLTSNYAFLMVGRFVSGIGVGYVLMITPVYITELAPASSRGFLTAIPEIFMNGGIIWGYTFSNISSCLPYVGWLLMLLIGTIPSILMVIFVCCSIPESPCWLIMQGRLDEGKRMLEITSDSKEEAVSRLALIREAVGISQSCCDEEIEVELQEPSQGKGVWKELLLVPTQAVRRILAFAIGLHFFQQCTGIDVVLPIYTRRIAEKLGIEWIDASAVLTVVVFAKMFAVPFALVWVDRKGRRPMLLCSCPGMIAALLTLATSLMVIENKPDKSTMTWAAVMCIIMLLAYAFFFSIGVGTVTWIYASEIFPLRLRAQGVSMCVAINRFTGSVLMAVAFISQHKNIITIAGALYLKAGIATAAWLFLYRFLPETKGCTLEDTQRLFNLDDDGDKSKWSAGAETVGEPQPCINPSKSQP